MRSFLVGTYEEEGSRVLEQVSNAKIAQELLEEITARIPSE